MALGLGVLVMTTFLAWYYQHALAQRPGGETSQLLKGRTDNSAMALPPLGRIAPPLVERILGPAPALPEETVLSPSDEARGSDERTIDRYQSSAEHSQSPDRRLSGDAFVPASTWLTRSADAVAGSLEGAGPVVGGNLSRASSSERSELAQRLEPTTLPAARAQVLPTRRLLLPKGSFLDCTLETAINSALPGMTTCVTATDTFGADGSVVLLERGSKLIGETRGDVRAGSNRVFVLWTEARTPTGVVVPLASPGTDELGRAGLPGEVDRHFWDRFGAAILISVIDGTIQAVVQRQSQGNSVIVNPANSTDIMTEVLKNTIQIPPTVTKRNGDRIAVLVARDLDFRSVYELRTATDR
jgi:type IV secretion system protein VirB10